MHCLLIVLAAKAPVYSFVFAYRSSDVAYPDWVTAQHGDDVAPVFGMGFRTDFKTKFSEVDTTFSRYIMAYWTNFAKTGYVIKDLDILHLPIISFLRSLHSFCT